MTAVIAWLLGSKIGRYVASVSLAIATFGLITWRIFASGRNAEIARQTQASLNNLRNRVKTDDQIARMPPDARRRELAGWLSGDKQ